MSIPIFINCRDRVTDLRRLVAWLEWAGHERITLLDNESTWEPLLDYLAETPHEVIHLERNHGAQALWHAGLVPDETFVYTDPDLIPIRACPWNLVNRLAGVLERYPDHLKAAAGLYLEDVPEDWEGLPWERRLVEADREIEPGVYDSLADTTFAVYRGGSRFELGPALRLGYPYQMRHMPWYITKPDAELSHYLGRALTGAGAGTTISL